MKKIFTIIIVFFPILSVYETFIPRLSYGDAILLLLFPVFIMRLMKNGFIKINRSKSIIFIFLLYLLVTFLIQIMLNTGVEFLSTIRYILYLFYLLISFENFDFEYGIKVIEKLTLIISVYVIIQFATYILFSRTLPWYISASSVIDQNFIIIESRDYYLTFYRPTGVFMEPTHFAQFTVVYLTYILLAQIDKKTEYFKALLVTFAVLASGSSLGLIFLIVVWGLWFILKQKNKFSATKIVLLVIAFALMIPLMFSIEYFENIISRMIVDKSFSGAAVGYRFSSLEYFKTADIPIINWLVGFGRGTEKKYFTGIFYFLANNGIIGLLIYLTIIIDTFIHYSKYGRWLTLIVFILSIGSEFIANFGVLFYLSFVFTSSNQKKENLEYREVI